MALRNGPRGPAPESGLPSTSGQRKGKDAGRPDSLGALRGDRVRHGHITRQGNPVVRSVLVESSWILIGKDPEMHRFYDKIKVRRRGKRAIVAVARKLCHRLLAVAQSGQPYRVNFSHTKEN